MFKYCLFFPEIPTDLKLFVFNHIGRKLVYFYFLFKFKKIPFFTFSVGQTTYVFFNTKTNIKYDQFLYLKGIYLYFVINIDGYTLILASRVNKKCLQTFCQIQII